jgi:hypothetical protein
MYRLCRISAVPENVTKAAEAELWKAQLLVALRYATEGDKILQSKMAALLLV